tara:strand:- start:391 stop:675 length:285 start_codon:yes stop_codon:yes gene_type:complete
MNIKAISFKEFLKNKKDLYKNINVVAKRARQIIDTRYDKVLATQNIDDSDQLEQVIDTDYDKDKSISKAMSEFLNDDLESKDFEAQTSELENEK